jgi:uncharacterized repeat protein (TIGR01451 family)
MENKMNSKLFRIFAMLVVFSMIVTPAFAQVPVPPTTGGATAGEKYQQVSPDEVISLNEPATYIVLFEGSSLVAAQGGASGLDATSSDSQAYLNTLAVARENILAQAQTTLGRKLEIAHVYDVILNGVAVKLTPDEAAAMEKVPGVRKVLRDTIEHITTDAGPTWIGAPTLWDGTAVPNGTETFGEGIVAGILDTGINFDHPSFSDTPADGYVYPEPAKYLGVCDPTNVAQYDPLYATACNDKIIGAYSYTRDSGLEPVTPEDSEGHGSHTASTVAGNFVDVNFYNTPLTISGVAPHAQIIAYDVCYPTPPNGACEGNDSVAAVQQAILDGVDVINFSISGGSNPYSDAVELAFLEAFNANIVVATSAGNSGPTAGTVAHLSPWLLSTAATTHNRKFTSEVNFSNPLYQGIYSLAGQIPFTTAVVDSSVKWAGEDTSSSTPPFTDNRQGCNAFPAGYFSSNIAMIKRGVCTFSVKILNAQAAGATGVLLYTDTRAPGAMSVAGTAIPAVMLDITGATGDALAAWVAATSGETVSVSAFGAIYDNAFGDIMGSFSSRGPTANLDVLKPDLGAPGVEILAAVADSTIAPDGITEISLYQGTSMASPHDAGSAALLKSLHPTWTPAMIKSALMLTAYDGVLKEDKVTPTTPFDIGSGRIALQLAGLTGLVMDETYDNFVAADPAAGGDVKTLNIASLYNSQCVGVCSWTRTFTSVSNVAATYTSSAPAWVTVNPATFTIAPGATQAVTFTANVSAFTPDAWQYATIEFNTDSHFSAGSTTLLTEGFETAVPPAGWAEYATLATGWQWGTTGSTGSRGGPHSGTYFAWHNDDSTGADNAWLVSPALSIPADGAVLSFWERNYWTPSYYELHEVAVSTASCVPADGNFVSLATYGTSAQSWTQRSLDLAAYAGQTICFAFHYTGDFADEWYIDDVAVTSYALGPDVSDVHIPAAILPTASNLPKLVKFETHRDAGAATLTDLVAVELTGLTVDTYGWVKGQQTVINLAQDPTNGSPYDNLSQVWYTVIPMDAGAARLVAEITASTAPDVDMFWGFDVNGDGKPQANEQYEASATSTPFEYLSDWGFPVGYYDVWVLVQNWAGSGAPTDAITLSLGNVPYAPVAPVSMDVVGPATNPATVPFSLDVFWHDIDTQEGDRLYGLADVYADPAYATNIGTMEMDVKRLADDVTKTANVSSVNSGDTITYTIEIAPNMTPDDLTYTIHDALPAGVTYVPGSVTGGATYDAGTNSILWNGVMPGSSSYYYAPTTSAADPNCTLALYPDADPTDDYLDWKTTSYGFSTSSAIFGDNLWYGTFSTYAPFNFYGVDYIGMEFTDDGYTGFDMAGVSPTNQNLPDPTNPNNIMALFWDDFQVVYDLAANKGVTMVGDGTTLATIEYDDLALKADPTKTLDMEVGYFLQPDNTPGAYEIIFAFDNITPGLFAAASGTIGVENATGTAGTLISYNDTALTIADGSAICFNWEPVPQPSHIITYQVVYNENNLNTLTNIAVHDNNALGTLPENAEVTITTHSSFPVAVDDEYSVLASSVLDIPADGVMMNDIIAGTDGRAVALVTATTHGIVTLDGDGSFVYTPEPGFVGVDTFVYELVTYPLGVKGPWTDQATVTITVNPRMIYMPVISR